MSDLATVTGMFIIGSAGVYAHGQARERTEKFATARMAATFSGKPLLVVGIPKGRHICGSATVDLDPAVLRECPVGGRVADVRALPFTDAMFGAAVASHVLEHLPVSDIPTAWAELHRVAERVFVAGPKPNLFQWFAPQHTCLAYQTPDQSLEVRELVTARLMFRLPPLQLNKL